MRKTAFFKPTETGKDHGISFKLGFGSGGWNACVQTRKWSGFEWTSVVSKLPVPPLSLPENERLKLHRKSKRDDGENVSNDGDTFSRMIPSLSCRQRSPVVVSKLCRYILNPRSLFIRLNSCRIKYVKHKCTRKIYDIFLSWRTKDLIWRALHVKPGRYWEFFPEWNEQFLFVREFVNTRNGALQLAFNHAVICCTFCQSSSGFLTFASWKNEIRVSLLKTSERERGSYYRTRGEEEKIHVVSDRSTFQFCFEASI